MLGLGPKYVYFVFNEHKNEKKDFVWQIKRKISILLPPFHAISVCIMFNFPAKVLTNKSVFFNRINMIFMEQDLFTKYFKCPKMGCVQNEGFTNSWKLPIN